MPDDTVIENMEDQFEWSPLHLLPLSWFDAATMDEPVVMHGTTWEWNDRSGR